jgi:hypothetical protein
MLAFRTFRWIRRRECATEITMPNTEKALATIDAALAALRDTPAHAAAADALSEARAFFADSGKRQSAESIDPGVSAYLQDLAARSPRAERDLRADVLTKTEEARETNIRC